MWQQAMRQSIEDGEMFTRYHFAKLVAAKAIAELESQEPVAWIEKDMHCDDLDPDSVTCEKPTIAADGWEWVALFTHPPQRTWVGLTKKEILLVNEKQDESIIAAPDDELIQFARAIEAKLKEKNT